MPRATGPKRSAAAARRSAPTTPAATSRSPRNEDCVGAASAATNERGQPLSWRRITMKLRLPLTTALAGLLLSACGAVTDSSLTSKADDQEYFPGPVERAN